jgi:hypothetical protein
MVQVLLQPDSAWKALARFDAGADCNWFTTVIVDHPMTQQLEHALARNPAMAGATILSPLSTTCL